MSTGMQSAAPVGLSIRDKSSKFAKRCRGVQAT
jgi:hypothetical protein